MTVCDSCDQPLAIYRVCCIDGCKIPPSVHAPGYPDCVDLCPRHTYLHDDEHSPAPVPLPTQETTR